MVTIYCIEDINDLKYVGSTKKNIKYRLSDHKYDKRRGKYISSSKLNLEYCIIYSLEECEEKDREDREDYWISQLECVNENRVNGLDKDKRREYVKIYHRNYRKKIKKNASPQDVCE